MKVNILTHTYDSTILNIFIDDEKVLVEKDFEWSRKNLPDIVEESGKPSEIDECSEPPKKKVARKKVIVYFMLSLVLDCYVKSN